MVCLDVDLIENLQRRLASGSYANPLDDALLGQGVN